MKMQTTPSVLPPELTDTPRWLLWREEQRTDAQGHRRVDKVPMRVGGGNGSTTDPTSWSSFADAQRGLSSVQNAKGLGFVFTDDDDIVGVDLDKCAADGVLEPWAAEIVDRFSGTYAEWSPSGTGVHLFVRGRLGVGRRKQGRVEAYSSGRYFTMTGKPLPRTSSRVLPMQDAIDWLQRTHLAPQTKPHTAAPHHHAAAGGEYLTDLLDLLSDQRADDYDEWLRVGMAIKGAGGSVGDWHRFSARCPAKYDPAAVDAKWAGLTPTQADLGWIVGKAREDAGDARVVAVKQRHGEYRTAVDALRGTTTPADPWVDHAAPAAAPDADDPLPTIGTLLQSFIDWRKTNAGRFMIGMECGMQRVDAALSGWRGLCLLAAQPGIGKTTLALQVGTQILQRSRDAVVVFFSSEMRGRDLAGRLLTMQTQLHYRTLALPDADPRMAERHDAQMRDAQQHYHERLGGRLVVFSPDQIEGASRDLVPWMRRQVDRVLQSAGCSEVFVVVDNLQQLPLVPPGAADKQWYSDLERDRYAIEQMMQLHHGIDNACGRACTVVISETNKRANEGNRSDMTAVLGSGRLVYKADTVLLMTHPEKDLHWEDGRPRCWLRVAKGRDGVERTRVLLTMDHHLHRFTEASEADYDRVVSEEGMR
jgi:replicative DNA helicase